MSKRLLAALIFLFIFLNINAQPFLYPTLKIDTVARFYEPEGADTIVMYLDVKNIRGGMANNAVLKIYASVPEVFHTATVAELGNIAPGATKTGIFPLHFSLVNDSNLRFYASVNEHYNKFGDSTSFSIYNILKKERKQQSEIMTNVSCNVNKEITVRMRGNITTGFTWLPSGNNWKEFLVLKSKNYVEDPNPELISGVGGTEEFIFIPQKSGKISIKFEFSRGTYDAARIAVYNFTISD
ncbi:MAG TPA: hypothetical protein DCQ31_03810 [Bacteroidales bacterium]|nr:hypothetical protein [Bacteroidales bacterium]